MPFLQTLLWFVWPPCSELRTPHLLNKKDEKYIHMQQTDPAATSLEFKSMCENYGPYYHALSFFSSCLPQLPRMPGNPWFLLDLKSFWPFAPSGPCRASGGKLLSTNEARSWPRDHANFLPPFLFKSLCIENDKNYQNWSIHRGCMGQNACISIILANSGKGLSSAGLVVCFFNFSVSPCHMATQIHCWCPSIWLKEFHLKWILKKNELRKHSGLFSLKLVQRSTNAFRSIKSATRN